MPILPPHAPAVHSAPSIPEGEPSFADSLITAITRHLNAGLPAAPAADASTWPAWTDEVVFWPSDDDAPGTDGDWTDGDPREEDITEEDREYAAANFHDPKGPNPGWVEGEPDASAIELVTVSAWDAHLEAMHEDAHAADLLESGCFD